MKINDFLVGVDFTVISSPTGADFNNGVNFAVAVPETIGDDTIGRGLVITTTDTALNVPNVPNAAAFNFTKFKRYQWNRRPFAGTAEKGSQVYHWNDDAPEDATLLHWVLQFVDTTTIEVIANNALNSANNAVTTANNASAQIASATTVANNASAAANTAVATANAAQTTANTGVTNAAAAQNTANIANATANTALGLVPRQSFYIKLSETQPKGTDAGGSTTGKNTRKLNTINWNGAVTPVALDSLTGLVTMSVGGYYLVIAEATMFDDTGTQNQLFLVDNVTNNNLLEGISLTYGAGGSNITQRATVIGIVQLIDNQVIRLDHYINSTQATNGRGKAANINPDAAGKEVYAILQMIPIGAN